MRDVADRVCSIGGEREVGSRVSITQVDEKISDEFHNDAH